MMITPKDRRREKNHGVSWTWVSCKWTTHLDRTLMRCACASKAAWRSFSRIQEVSCESCEVKLAQKHLNKVKPFQTIVESKPAFWLPTTKNLTRGNQYKPETKTTRSLLCALDALRSQIESKCHPKTCESRNPDRQPKASAPDPKAGSTKPTVRQNQNPVSNGPKIKVPSSQNTESITPFPKSALGGCISFFPTLRVETTSGSLVRSSGCLPAPFEHNYSGKCAVSCFPSSYRVSLQTTCWPLISTNINFLPVIVLRVGAIPAGLIVIDMLKGTGSACNRDPAPSCTT